jgi:hypothetical protein
VIIVRESTLLDVIPQRIKNNITPFTSSHNSFINNIHHHDKRACTWQWNILRHMSNDWIEQKKNNKAVGTKLDFTEAIVLDHHYPR